MSQQRVNVALLLERAADPTWSAIGRRTEFLVDVLRAWAEPITYAELLELLDWEKWQLTPALEHGRADGRIGRVGGRRPCRYIADPDITATLVPAGAR